MRARKRKVKRQGLVRMIREHRVLIFSEEYKERSRKRKADFTRERKLPFGELVCFMLNQLKQSTQTALDRYFDIGGEDKHMSQQSFSEARQKLRWEACRELMDASVSGVYSGGYSTWHGYRVWAIDGSKIQLPSDAKLREYYGTFGGSDRAVTAQSSCLYDILNDIIGDALLEPVHIDERNLALCHLEHLIGMKSFGKELAIMDRGYASAALISEFKKANVRFLMRVRSKWNADIDALPIGDHRYVLQGNGVELRVLKFLLPSGETETLITDLFDKRMGTDAFKALYFKRWPIETKYAELKHKLEVENFSGRTIDAVQQDFYITAYLSNMMSVAANDAQPIIDDLQADNDNIYEYKVNKNHAVGVFKDRFIAALLEPNRRKSADSAMKIVRLLTHHLTPVRPDRSNPRNPPRQANFHANRKSNC